MRLLFLDLRSFQILSIVKFQHLLSERRSLSDSKCWNYRGQFFSAVRLFNRDIYIYMHYTCPFVEEQISISLATTNRKDWQLILYTYIYTYYVYTSAGGSLCKYSRTDDLRLILLVHFLYISCSQYKSLSNFL